MEGGPAARPGVAVDEAPSARCAPGAWKLGVPDRPARVQLDLSTIRLQAPEVQGDYNIWYDKYAGEHGHHRSAAAATRCHLDTDAGRTQADVTESHAPLCIHFARGACAYGAHCTYRHRAPLDEDEGSAESRLDVFGRERHNAFRDDMGGVGSWSRDQRTLYVGRVCVLRAEPEVHATVYNHFSEWGEIDYCRVLIGKGCAFVAYRLRAAAEFAKEAMADQALEDNEQLNLRWAYEDPNPRAKADKLRAQASTMLAAMRKRGHLPDEQPAAPHAETYAAELLQQQQGQGEGEGQQGPGKRARGAAADGAAAPAAATVYPAEAVPLTREQAFAQRQAAAAAEEEAACAESTLAAAQAEHAAASRLDSILGRIDGGGGGDGGSGRGGGGGGGGGGGRARGGGGDGGAAAALPAGGATAEARQMPSASDAAAAHAASGGWQLGTDPATGCAYYYNHYTGESRWAQPHEHAGAAGAYAGAWGQGAWSYAAPSPAATAGAATGAVAPTGQPAAASAAALPAASVGSAPVSR